MPKNLLDTFPTTALRAGQLPGLDPLTGMRWTPSDAKLCSAEGDGVEGSEGGAPSSDGEKTFSQAEVDRIVQQRIRKESQKYESKLKELEGLQEKASKADELAKRIEELEEANLSESEKAKRAAEKAQQRIEQEREQYAKTAAEREAEATRYREQLRETRMRYQLSDAMQKAKALDLDDAIDSFLKRADDVETDDDDRILAVTYGGVRHSSLTDALAAFEKDKPIYFPAPAGGAGTRGPNGRPPSKSHDEMSASELAFDGLKRAGVLSTS